jgi:hypothetical protein
MASGKIRYYGDTIEPYYDEGARSTFPTDAKYKIYDIIGACPVLNLLSTVVHVAVLMTYCLSKNTSTLFLGTLWEEGKR